MSRPRSLFAGVILLAGALACSQAEPADRESSPSVVFHPSSSEMPDLDTGRELGPSGGAPEVIVLGGSIAANRPELFDVVRREIDRRSFATPARRVRVVPAEHGDDVSLIGLLPIVNERLNDPAYRRGRTPVANA